jgi:hypothetical protein
MKRKSPDPLITRSLNGDVIIVRRDNGHITYIPQTELPALLKAPGPLPTIRIHEVGALVLKLCLEAGATFDVIATEPWHAIFILRNEVSVTYTEDLATADVIEAKDHDLIVTPRSVRSGGGSQRAPITYVKTEFLKGSDEVMIRCFYAIVTQVITAALRFRS